KVPNPECEVILLYIKRNGYGHFYGIKDLNLLEMVSCSQCYDWFYSTSHLWENHCLICKRCPRCKSIIKPLVEHVCRERQRKFPKEIKKKDQKKDKENWDEDIWFADFESYTKGDGTQHVYCAAIISIAFIQKFKFKEILHEDVICERFWGDNCIELFVDFLISIKKPITICFYNGCRFDYYFIVQEMIHRKLDFDFQKDEKTSMISILRYKKINF